MIPERRLRTGQYETEGRMNILNIGSMNLDLVYTVDHIVQPGETESAFSLDTFLGGKGLNQSIALAKAGNTVYLAGMIGEDGQCFLDACRQYGVCAEHIRQVAGKSGHAVIQRDRAAQNSILLYGGANQQLTKAYVDEVLSHFGAGDLLLLQNEVNLLPYIVDEAWKKGMRIALNPSPFNEKLSAVDMQKVSIFLLNEIEGNQLTGEVDPQGIIVKMREIFPKAQIVLTLGEGGAVYSDKEQTHFQPAFSVQAVDTTAAGDTFTGYFLSELMEGTPIPEALQVSAKAASIAVTREGAIPSIPYREEVVRSPKEN